MRKVLDGCIDRLAVSSINHKLDTISQSTKICPYGASAFTLKVSIIIYRHSSILGLTPKQTSLKYKLQTKIKKILNHITYDMQIDRVCVCV